MGANSTARMGATAPSGWAQTALAGAPNLFGPYSHYTGPAVKQACGRARGRDGFVPSQVDKEFS
jgi:hypothetical protein